MIGLTLYGVGVTVGAGTYVLVGKVAGHDGEVAPLAFLIAALVAVMSALSFAALSSRFPRSAGEAVYVREAFGKPALSFLVGLAVAVTGLISAGALLVGSAGYIASSGALVPHHHSDGSADDHGDLKNCGIGRAHRHRDGARDRRPHRDPGRR